MKQEQQQNIIINLTNPIKRRKKRTNKPKPDEKPIISNYNPNLLTIGNSHPSYGLRSINPLIQEDPQISQLIDKVKTLEPTIQQYRRDVEPKIIDDIEEYDIEEEEKPKEDLSMLSGKSTRPKMIIKRRGRPPLNPSRMDDDELDLRILKLDKVKKKTLKQSSDLSKLKRERDKR